MTGSSSWSAPAPDDLPAAGQPSPGALGRLLADANAQPGTPSGSIPPVPPHAARPGQPSHAEPPRAEPQPHQPQPPRPPQARPPRDSPGAARPMPPASSTAARPSYPAHARPTPPAAGAHPVPDAGTRSSAPQHARGAGHGVAPGSATATATDTRAPARTAPRDPREPREQTSPSETSFARRPSPVPAVEPPPTGSVAEQPIRDRLPRRATAEAPALWVLGAHGGAGESSLARSLVGARAAEHAWPTGPGSAPVLLCARTSMTGLRAAQRALADWASGATGASLAGLVLVADAPAGLPRHLSDTAALLASITPRLWRLPWSSAWRESETPGIESADRRLSKALRVLANDLSVTLDERTDA